MSSSPQEDLTLTLSQKVQALAERYSQAVQYDPQGDIHVVTLSGIATLWVHDTLGVSLKVPRYSKSLPDRQREIFRDFLNLAQRVNPFQLLVDAVSFVDRTPLLTLEALSTGNDSSFVEITLPRSDCAWGWSSAVFLMEPKRKGRVVFSSYIEAEAGPQEYLEALNDLRRFLLAWRPVWEATSAQELRLRA